MKLRASVLATVGMLCACHSSTLVADGPVSVLQNPYPTGDPSTAPMPNSVVATLSVGQRVPVKSVGYGKDFKFFEVALPAGGTGYVFIGDGAFHVED